MSLWSFEARDPKTGEAMGTWPLLTNAPGSFVMEDIGAVFEYNQTHERFEDHAVHFLLDRYTAAIEVTEADLRAWLRALRYVDEVCDTPHDDCNYLESWDQETGRVSVFCSHAVPEARRKHHPPVEPVIGRIVPRRVAGDGITDPQDGARGNVSSSSATGA